MPDLKILLNADINEGVETVKSWLDFNKISHELVESWDMQNKVYWLPEVENTIFVTPYFVLQRFLYVESVRQKQIATLKKFCNKNNQLWLVGTDVALRATHAPLLDLFQNIDKEIQKSSIVIFSDAQISTGHPIFNLQNIEVIIRPVNQFMSTVLRYQSSSLIKSVDSKDFLLTMVKKSGREHRDILWQELCSRDGLRDRGIAQYNNTDGTWVGYVGEKPHERDWWNGFASMELYNNCYVEVVPETAYKYVQYFTEKTHKPIMTKTPFLMVTSAGYLKYLQNLGFKTFESLIDETYDQQHRIEDRIKKLIDVLQHICDNGADDFYHASMPILDHNFLRLAEIAGSWHCLNDQAYWQALDKFKSRL